MFGLIRLVLGGLLWLLTTLKIKKSMLVHKCKYYIITTAGAVILTILLAFVPLENAFITFNSPETAYKYYNIGTERIELVVSGQYSDLVIGKNNHSDVCLIIPKTDDGWKLGLGINTKKVSQKMIDAVSIYIYQYKNSNDYFLIIQDTKGEPLNISDSNKSDFISVTRKNHALDKTFWTYYSSIPNFNEEYWLSINGTILMGQDDDLLVRRDG